MLLRYIKGYVQIKVTGGFNERFLNLCYSFGISLWDVFFNDDIMKCCISRKDFLKLRSVAAKSGVKITIIKKTGLIYKYRKYNKRIGLMIGVFIFLIIHLFLNMFVWCVDIKGNNSINKSELLSLAEHYGLSEGTLKKGFDEIRAARKIASDFEGKITWLSINIKGSLAVIELREDNTIIPEIQDRTPCNIVADFDGIILSAETYYGDCMVKKGTGIKKGDMLINGAIINEDLSTTFYAAKGKLTALHDKEIKLKKPERNDIYSLTVTDKKYKLTFFGLEIPLGIINDEKDSLVLSEKKILNINGYNLPFSIEKQIIYKKTRVNKNTHPILDFEEIQNSIYRENANSTVVSKSENLYTDNGAIIYSGKYTLIDFIGEEKPILSEK